MNNYFEPANRIAFQEPYFFAQLTEKINELISRKVDVIRIDMGSPDLPPEDFIIDALVNSAKQPGHHGYTPNGGSPSFRDAIAAYYVNRFGVELDPEKEIVGLIGSKEGLFHLSQVMLNPGDYALVPDPGYPVYSGGARIAGAQIYAMPLLEENAFLPDLDAIPAEVVAKAKILWLNYPNNPTGAIADLAFFKKAVNFGRTHHILIAHDAPYADVCFDGYHAPSILQIPGAEDVCVEFNSLSKTYNMAGWRLGMAVGNSQVIKWLKNYKSQMDSSQFEPMMDAGSAAMLGEQKWLEKRNRIYQERRDIVISCLRSAGLEVNSPKAAIYVWSRIPADFKKSTDFCSQLLEETGVSTTPGTVYGGHGEGYFRISLSTETVRMKEAMERLKQWCLQHKSEKNV